MVTLPSYASLVLLKQQTTFPSLIRISLLLPFAKCLFPLSSSSLMLEWEDFQPPGCSLPSQSRLTSSSSQQADPWWGPLGEKSSTSWHFPICFLLWFLTSESKQYFFFFFNICEQSISGVSFCNLLLHCAIVTIFCVCVVFWLVGVLSVPTPSNELLSCF